MANHKGSEGTVHIGTDAIAEIKSYSVNESMNVIDDSTIGDTEKHFNQVARNGMDHVTFFGMSLTLHKWL
jgi:hypothetical protein